MLSFLEKIKTSEEPLIDVLQQGDGFKVMAIGLKRDVGWYEEAAPERKSSSW